MLYEPLKSFNRSLKSLDTHRRSRAEKAILKCVDAFERGEIPLGLGLKKLAGNIWEIRVGLDLRILFQREENLVRWALAGSHDDVRIYLKTL